MYGMPYTSELSYYLNGGMDPYSAYTPSAYNMGLSVPKLKSLSVDAFTTTAQQVDKRNVDWKRFALWLGVVAGAGFGAKCCLSKSCELIAAPFKAVGNGIKNLFTRKKV